VYTNDLKQKKKNENQKTAAMGKRPSAVKRKGKNFVRKGGKGKKMTRIRIGKFEVTSAQKKAS